MPRHRDLRWDWSGRPQSRDGELPNGWNPGLWEPLCSRLDQAGNCSPVGAGWGFCIAVVEVWKRHFNTLIRWRHLGVKFRGKMGGGESISFTEDYHFCVGWGEAESGSVWLDLDEIEVSWRSWCDKLRLLHFLSLIHISEPTRPY